MDVTGLYPLRGRIEWLPRAEAGRRTPPRGPTFAATGWREDVGPDGIASFVVRGSDLAASASRAEGRWLFAQPDDHFRLSPGDVVVVSEGLRPIGRFFIDGVEGPGGSTSAAGRSEA